MSKHIKDLEDWTQSIREDIHTLEDVLASDTADKGTRRLAAAGLNYLVSRMDLIPDWEPTIGVLDDVMVLRVCASGALQAGVEGLDDKVSINLGRMANQDEIVQAYLGSELYGKLRAHCRTLSEQTVRGRSMHDLLTDADARKGLGTDVREALGKLPPVDCSNPEEIDVKLKAYLGHKLKDA